MRANTALIGLSLLLASLAFVAPPAQASHTCATADAVPETFATSGTVSSGSPNHWYSHTTSTGIGEYTVQPSPTSDVDLDVYAADCTTLLCSRAAGTGVADRCVVAGANGATFKVRVSYFAGPGSYDISFRPSPRCNVTTGVSLCLVSTTPINTFVVPNVGLVGAPNHVAAYHDLYRFPLPGGGSTVLDCVVLVVNNAVPNGCALAGGTFVQRLNTLVDRTDSLPATTTPLVTVRVCQAVLSVAVLDRGVDNVPAATLC